MQLQRTHHAAVDEVVHGAIGRLSDPDTSIHAAMRELVCGLVRLHDENPTLMAALSGAVVRESVAASERLGPGHDEAEHEAIPEALARREDVRSGDWRLMSTLSGLATEAMTRWLAHEAPPDVDRERAADEIAWMLTAYLQKPPERLARTDRTVA